MSGLYRIVDTPIDDIREGMLVSLPDKGGFDQWTVRIVAHRQADTVLHVDRWYREPGWRRPILQTRRVSYECNSTVPVAVPLRPRQAGGVA